MIFSKQYFGLAFVSILQFFLFSEASGEGEIFIPDVTYLSVSLFFCSCVLLSGTSYFSNILKELESILYSSGMLLHNSWACILKFTSLIHTVFSCLHWVLRHTLIFWKKGFFNVNTLQSRKTSYPENLSHQSELFPKKL